MMERCMSNTCNAVHHLAVTVGSDICMKCNIYSEKNNDFQKAKSSLKRCNAYFKCFLEIKKKQSKKREVLKECYLSAVVHLQIAVRNSSMNNYINCNAKYPECQHVVLVICMLLLCLFFMKYSFIYFSVTSYKNVDGHQPSRAILDKT